MAAIALWLLVTGYARADGCFVFIWDKQKDINEPTQKAILLHDQGREDLVLQVKYQGPAEEFGWLVPVPGLPEVKKGSMDGFYELSRLTQEHWREGHSATRGFATAGGGTDQSVKVIEIKTVGAYEVAVLSSSNAASLTEWLEANRFVFPKDKQALLDGYIQKGWYFVAAKINPESNGFALKSSPAKKAAIAHATRKKLANGELHPLVLSFPSEKCIFPLAISAVNGRPSEVSLYVLSAEPLMSRVIFHRKLEAYRQEHAQWLKGRPEREKARQQSREHLGALRAGFARYQGRDADLADPPPAPEVMRQLSGASQGAEVFTESEDEDYASTQDLVKSMEVHAKQIPGSLKELPRLADKSWWLTKQVQIFKPEEMCDLEFEPAVPLLAEEFKQADGPGPGPAHALAQFGMRAMPVLLGALQSSDPAEHRLALATLTDFGFSAHRDLNGSGAQPGREAQDPHLTAALARLLEDKDSRIRAKACEAAAMSWDTALVPRLTQRLRDEEPRVRATASFALQQHWADAKAQLPAYRKMVEEDGPATPYAMRLYVRSGTPIPEDQLAHLLASTNLPVVSMAFSQLHGREFELGELEPLLTNSMPTARLMGLNALTRIGDKTAAQRIVAMLRDPNEGVRWRVRSSLRQLSGKKLGADPAAWEGWWEANKESFTPQPLPHSPWQSR